jgi:hypothetical protein
MHENQQAIIRQALSLYMQCFLLSYIMPPVIVLWFQVGQTDNSFIEISKEAGILLSGNGKYIFVLLFGEIK